MIYFKDLKMYLAYFKNKVTSSSATEEKADELLCDSKRSEDGTVSEFLLDKAYRVKNNSITYWNNWSTFNQIV